MQEEHAYDESGSAKAAVDAKEAQYGVQYGNPVVDLDHLNSEAYSKKFAALTDNDRVNTSICEVAKDILNRRNGTEFESMFLVNAEDGSVLAKVDENTVKYGICYTAEFATQLEACKQNGTPIIAIHNHPGGTPPSPDDFRKAFENGYAFGVVVGHNGQIYLYETPSKPVDAKEMESMDTNIDFFFRGGMDIDRAYGMAYRDHGLNYTIIETEE